DRRPLHRLQRPVHVPLPHPRARGPRHDATLRHDARAAHAVHVLTAGAAVHPFSDGSSGADRLSTVPATAGDASIFASSARSRTATSDSVASPVRSTSPITETRRGPTNSRRRYVTRATSGSASSARIAAART